MPDAVPGPTRRPALVLSDRAVTALAVGAAVGAWVGGGPGLLAAVVVVAVAVLVVRRPWLLVLGTGLLAAALADRALAGLDPVARSPVDGWVTLVTDPEPLDGGGVRVDVRWSGRRIEATAFGGAAGAVADRLAGERLRVRGTVRPPPEHAPWLVARRVVGRLTIDSVAGWRPGSLATRAANGIRRTLDHGAQGLPTASRSLLNGVVLGDDREQPPELTDDFRAAGLSHLLAVSGQNVSFTLALAAPLLTRLRWSARAPTTLVLLAGFALLVRFEPSVLRAVAMAVVATLAAALGRPAAGVRILGLAVTGLVLVDPLLVRSVGFGLSVSASAAILVLGPRIQALLPGPRWLVEPLAVTLAAQVGTLPLLLATFGSVPVAAVPANLLAVPMAAPLMMWGLTAGLVAGVASPLAGLLHGPTAVMTGWLAAVARRSAALPLGELRFAHAAVVLVALGGLLLARWWRPRAGVGRAERAAAVAVLGVAVVAALGRPALTSGSRPVGRHATVWASGGGRALLVDGPVAIASTLGTLRQAGIRCVGVVAVDGGGRSAAGLVAALRRRCGDGLAVVAPEGGAHPGWIPLTSGAGLAVGGLRIGVTADGHVRVGSSVDAAVARGPPR